MSARALPAGWLALGVALALGMALVVGMASAMAQQASPPRSQGEIRGYLRENADPPSPPRSQGELRAYMREDSSKQLSLPRSQGEIRALLRETDGLVCVRCGIVRSVQAVAPDRPLAGPPSGTAALSALGGGLGSELWSGADMSKAEINKARQGPAQRYEVIVHYDDGSFGRVEMARDPMLARGERVVVKDGSVARYP